MAKQFIRKANLIVTDGTKGLDLSELRFTFDIRASDFSAPNNAKIRVFNLDANTVSKVKGEFSQVQVQAGYQDSDYGVIFKGTIKQFRVGRENATDTYLDILAADGDIGFNQAVINRSWPAGSTANDHLAEVAKAMDLELKNYTTNFEGSNPSALPRGRVMFGMARTLAQQASDTLGSSWSIQGGQLQVIPLQKYLPGEAVVLNPSTGMIGIPEQTDQGINVRCLLNPKLRIGGLVKLNTKDINQLISKTPETYNSYAELQYASKLAEGADGLYRVYVIDYLGDTWGNDWYSDIVCITVDSPAQQTEAVN